MSSYRKNFMDKRFKFVVAGLTLASALVLTACGSGGSSSGSGSAKDAVVIGTTDKIITIDPAGSYDNGSFAVENNVYPFLYNFAYGSTTPEPDVADGQGEFSADGTEYTVKIKSGLKFANGHDLTPLM